MEPNNTPPQDSQPTEQPNTNNNPQDSQAQASAPAPSQPTQPSPQPPAMPWDRPQQSSQDGTPSQPSPAPVFGTNQQSFGQPKKNKKKVLAVLVGVLAGVLLLGGGAAAAYFGVVVPNKPENVLRQALENTLQEDQFTAKGAYEMKPVDASKEDAPVALKAAFEAKSSKEVGELKLDLTVSGIDLPIEARYVDDSIYIKTGDLTTLSALASGYAPMLGVDSAQADSLIKKVSGLVSNQWVEIDSTLLDQAGASCVMSLDASFTEKDMQLLQELFTKHQFAKIDSTSKDTVNGKNALKYEVSVDDDKLAKFVEDKKLENLSALKALDKCPDEGMDDSIDTKELADGDITPLTLWVDKDTKRIAKIAGKSTKMDADKSNLAATFEALIGYEKVTVSKPENAKPVMQLWGELQQEVMQIFGGLSADIPADEDFAMDEEFDFDDSSQFNEYITQ